MNVVISSKILQLRQLLTDRFGHAALPDEETYLTGFPALDEAGLPQAALTELVAPPASGPGGSLLLYGLLHAALQKGERVILIDGRDAFVPQGLPQLELNRLLWMRCHDAWETIKAADLAVRDGNIPLVILLLTLNPPAKLRRIPATAWHRLQMLAEKSAVTLLVFTPQAQIGGARLRLSVGGAFPLEKLHRCRRELLPALALHVERRRLGAGRRDDEELRRAACA
ncbi:MAG TPA: hypothetical protein VGC39_04405 [Candidatus Methylacidiphilales bacterium]